MTQRPLVLYDDVQARMMEPFALARPLGEVRAGALLIRERWERVSGASATGFCSARHLSRFDEPGAPETVTGMLRAGTVVVNTRFAPALARGMPALSPGESLRAEGLAVAVALSEDVEVETFSDGTTALDTLAPRRGTDVDGWWLHDSWDLIRHLTAMLTADARVLAGAIPDEPPAHVSVLGEHRLAVARGAYLEPHVVADTTNGDVIIMDGARIAAFTRLAGPCVIGPHTIVNGGRISGCSIGTHSRACGEMSVVIVNGYANKGHDGFIGHSVIGRWANLGAGTTTSNLKNNYGHVRMRDTRGEHDTGMQYLGSLIGDHAKTAIGTRLMTGTIVGAGANVFGDRSPDKLVPPFAWGDRPPFERHALEKFLETAAHVMSRRDTELTTGMRDALTEAWTMAGAPTNPASASAARIAPGKKRGR